MGLVCYYDTNMYKYLYAYHGAVYNDSEASREIEPIKNSNITRAVVFGGVRQHSIGSNFATPYLYLESSAKLKEDNLYRNLRLYENLICLSTGKRPMIGHPIEIDGGKSLLMKLLKNLVLAKKSIINQAYRLPD